MARTVNRLTAVEVSRIKAPGLYPDGGGLYLRVTKTRTRNWVFRYARFGRTRDMGLGSAVEVSLAQARKAALAARQALVAGDDPVKRRTEARAEAQRAELSRSFADCATDYINRHEAGWRNAKHRQQWRSTLETYASPVFGRLPVREVDTQLVMKVLESIWIEKPETASRLRGRIEAILSWAKVMGYRDGPNPAQWRGNLDQLLPSKGKIRKVRHHAALPYAEIPSFMALLRTRRGVSSSALEFVILTAARTGEVLQARWSEILFDEKVWLVPGERMKAGRDHRVPLSGRALEILREMAIVRRSEFVFPSGSASALSNMALLMLLRDLRPGITAHGFRSTFKDWCADCTNVPNFVSEAALAHVVADRVEAAYRRTELLEKRRELMKVWSEYCGAADAV